MNETDSIDLICAATGCPQPMITWKKVGDTKILHTGSSYTISNIQKAQNGLYVCSTTTAGATVNATTKLTIQCEYQSAVG